MVLNSENFDKDSFSFKYLNSRKEDWLIRAKIVTIQSLKIFFKPKYSIKSKRVTQIIMEIVINSLNIIQIVTLLWYPTMSIQFWKKFGIYWQLFGYFSFDSWISDSRLYFPAFLLIVTILWTSIIYISIISTLIFWSWKIPKAFIKLPSFLFGFLFSVGYIPSLMILLVTAKYSFLADPDGTLYSSLPKNKFSLGVLGSILGISSAVLLFLLAIIYELFTADVRHSFSNFNIKARSDSNLDLAQLFTKFIVVFIYVFYGYDHFIWHIWFVFSLSLIFSYLTFKFNSYFNPILNAIKITQLLILSGFAFSFLIGVAMDNAGVTFILSICVIPAAGLLIFRRILILVENAKESQIALDQHAFELQIRKLLMDTSPIHIDNIINKFAEIYNIPMFRRDKLLVAWEVYYFLHTVNDIRLAKIRYARMGSVISSIEGEIQALRIDEWMKRHPGTDQIANNFLLYLIDLQVAKKEDEVLCRYLLELWYEVFSKKSNLNKLENLSNEVYHEINKVEDLYKKMLHTNHAHVYELYGGLLQNILQEFTKGRNLLHKVYQLKSEEEFTIHENIITKFDEYSGNMLISAQKKKFGTIVYVNEIAAQILKETSDNIVGNKIDQYIPKPYNEFHAESMKKFVDTCADPQLGKRDTLFIIDHNGNLSECKFLIRLTALDESLYYMVSMMACTKNREVALISKEGMIYSHSQNFHHLLNIEKSCFIFKTIDDIIPEIDFCQMVLFKPKLIQRKEKIIAVIYCKKDFKSTEIPYIVLVQDFYEINAWTKGEAYEQIKYTEHPPILTNSENNFDIKRRSKFLSIESDKHELLKQTNHHLTTLDENVSEADSTIMDIVKSDEGNSNFLEKTLSSATHSVSSHDNRNHYLDKGVRIISKSQKSLKWFKLVLFLSILLISVSNIAISIYISKSVNHTKLTETFNDLGIIMYSMIASANYARTIDFCTKYDKTEINTYIELLQTSKSDFLAYQNHILDNYDSWSYCHSSKIVKSNLLSTWEFLDTPKVLYKNLHDEIDLFIDHSENFIYKLNHSEDYTENLQFLISNGFGENSKQINSSLYGLIDCEINQIHKLNSTVKLLVIIQSVFSGICIIVLIMIVYSINKRYNLLWNFIIQAAAGAYFDLVALCLDRLSSVHGVDFNQDRQEALQKTINKGKTVHFTVSSRYILRLLILFSITIVYYVCVHVYIYPICEKYLIERPELLGTYISRKALAPAIGFWAREAGLRKFDNESWALMPDIFSNPNDELDKTLSSFHYKNKLLLDRMEYMSSLVKSNLFEHKTILIPGFSYGTFWYTNLLFYDAWDLQYNKENFFEASQNLANHLTQLQQLMTGIYKIIDQTSQNMILEKSNFILYGAIAYVIAITILYFLYYIPYIKHEMAMLSKLQLIISIIPSYIKSEKSPKHS